MIDAREAEQELRVRPRAKASANGRPRSETHRKSILAAALELLEHETVQSVTSEAIAQRAGVSKATIYRWWTSKLSVVIDAFVEHQVLHTPMDMTLPPAEALLKHWRQMAVQYSGRAGRIASQIVAAGQSDPAIMQEFLEKFLAERMSMSHDVVERMMESCPQIGERLSVDMFMELFYSPIHTRVLLRHLPLSADFIQNFPLDFFRSYGVEFDGDGRLAAPRPLESG